MDGVEETNNEWLKMFSDRVNEQFILSRTSQQNTHHWVISLALALITAALTIGSNQNPYPSEFNFIAVLVSLPLMFRFFIRSCLETSIQNRWMIIRNALDRYFYVKSKESDKLQEYREYLDNVISLYYFDWNSPTKIGKIIWDNVRLAYFWPFIVIVFLILWGYIALSETTLMWISTLIVSCFMIFEIVTFFCYKGFKYQEPNIEEPKIDLDLIDFQKSVKDKLMRYILEIYEPGSESASDCLLVYKENTAFPKISEGEILNLFDIEEVLLVKKIEHLIWENEKDIVFKTMIYTERITP